jgi:hypothetical protein
MIPCFITMLIALTSPPAQQRVNPDSAIIVDFQKRVDVYVKLRRSLESRLTAIKSAATPQEVEAHQRELTALIHHARRHEKRGDLLTPTIEAEFRRLVGLATDGPNARRVSKSLKHAEPVALRLHVNDTYPANVPMQSTPPTLLMNFPALPKELEYRFAGEQLVLVDAGTNLIVDVSKTAFLPKPQ